MNILRTCPVDGSASPITPVRRGSWSHAVRGEQGATLAEFSLALMVLVLVMFGIADFGRALYAYHFVSLASRQATRWAMVRGSFCSGFPSACPASSTDIANYVVSIAPGGIDTTKLTTTANCGNPGVGGARGPCATPNNNPGKVVNVTVQYNFSFLYGFVSGVGTTMSSSSQMIIWQ